MLPYVFLVRIHSLIYPVVNAPSTDHTLITNGFLNTFSSPLSQNIVACIFIFFQAVLINRMVIQHRISRHITLFPGVFYILLTSFLPEYSFFSEYLIANTFFIIALSEFMKIYLKSHKISNIFNSGVLLFIGVAIVPEMSLLLLFGILAIIILNALNILNILQYVGGVVISLLLLIGTHYLLNDQLWSDTLLMKPAMEDSVWNVYSQNYRLFILVICCILLALIGYNTYNVKKSINAQRKIDMLYFFLLFAVIPYFFNYDLAPDRILPIFIPISIFAAMSFLDIRNNVLAEFLHLLILAGLFMLHFGISIG